MFFEPPTWDFQVWAEGYSATGDSSGARLLGTVRAESFHGAVMALVLSAPEGERHHFRHNTLTSEWTFWGCRFFDNEADARKSFG